MPVERSAYPESLVVLVLARHVSSCSHAASAHEGENAMTAPVDHEAVPRGGAQSDVSLRAPAKHGLAVRSAAGLTFLGINSARLFGAFRLSTKRLSVIVGSR